MKTIQILLDIELNYRHNHSTKTLHALQAQNLLDNDGTWYVTEQGKALINNEVTA